jgi:hypothetical protein
MAGSPGTHRCRPRPGNSRAPAGFAPAASQRARCRRGAGTASAWPGWVPVCPASAVGRRRRRWAPWRPLLAGLGQRRSRPGDQDRQPVVWCPQPGRRPRAAPRSPARAPASAPPTPAGTDGPAVRPIPRAGPAAATADHRAVPEGLAQSGDALLAAAILGCWAPMSRLGLKTFIPVSGAPS